MPRLVHTLCCCLRPPNNYNKKNDTASNSENPDSRSSPITQASKGQPSKSIAPHLAGDLRQRLTPRNEGSKGHNLAQRTQNAANNNNNTLTLMTNEVPRNKQQHANEQQHNFLLQRVLPIDLNRKCLVVDLDETLVHSSFKPVKNADFVIPVEIDNVVHQVYVLKRPHTDHFLERIGYLFECVLFTASLAKYADPVGDLLDKKRIFRSRLFRESCVYFEGNYVKDLERLGRDLRKVVIIDNSPASYAFHPDNAIAVRTWFDDPNDTELLDLLPMLEELAQSDDIYSVLGTVPPHQQPRCLTPSEDLIQPPPIASSSPITQVTPNNNGTTQQPQQPWKRDRSALRLSSSPFNEMRRTVTMDAVPSGTRR